MMDHEIQMIRISCWCAKIRLYQTVPHPHYICFPLILLIPTQDYSMANSIRWYSPVRIKLFMILMNTDSIPISIIIKLVPCRNTRKRDSRNCRSSWPITGILVFFDLLNYNHIKIAFVTAQTKSKILDKHGDIVER